MKSRRDFLLLASVASAAFAMLPDRAVINGGTPAFGWAQALAGNGNGNGNDGGRGNNGNGNGGRDSGKSNNGKSGEAAGGRNGADASRGVKDGWTDTNDPGSLSVRHSNGTTERISEGRYEMRDARSRTIVNRRATESDRSRLEALNR
jgi:hypothetical protein